MKLPPFSLKKSLASSLNTLLFLSFTSTVYAAPPNEWQCKSYARDAVEQNRQNISAACGFTGLRWSNNEKGQKQWCLTVNDSISSQERNIRQDMLEKCFSKKASRSNPENQVDIPQACQDPSRAYIPIRKIYSGFRYDRSLHSVVDRSGLIRYDFNGDSQSDYLFAELNTKNNLRVVTCISHRADGYQRVLSDVSFNTDLYSLASEQYTISFNGGLLHIDIDYFGHNEGSCFSRGRYSFKKDEQRFKIVDSDSGCSPVIDSYGQPYPLSPPSLPRMYQ